MDRLCHYVLARWACGSSDRSWSSAPRPLGRMWQACAEAEEEGTDDADLAVYAKLRQMINWRAAA